jgi:hypothetical protein
MLQVPEVGPFVRVLMPVRLLGGDVLTFGLWLGVHPDDLQRAFAEWWAPTYPDWSSKDASATTFGLGACSRSQQPPSCGTRTKRRTSLAVLTA